MTPFVLLILDGWGLAPNNPGNAIALAKTPNFNQLWSKYPHTQLKAHGRFVGLPHNQVGNSEAGHLNIGAGRIVEQESVVISKAISQGKFQKNLAFKTVIKHAQANHSCLHLLGLASDKESPHSSLDHLYALVELAYSFGLRKIYVHLITDGRDSAQFSALKIIDEILKNIHGKAIITTIIGRFFAMDRAKNWQRLQKAYDALTLGKGLYFTNHRDAIIHAYNQKITDEFIEPSLVCKTKSQAKQSRIRDNDSIIFFNLRSDRARQLTKFFVQKDFNKKNPGAPRRQRVLKNIKFCALTDFGPDLDDVLTAFPSPNLKNTLPMVLQNLTQLYIAETEKYAHMTYFINGGYADPVAQESRMRIPSPKIKNYSHKPEMSVYKITDAVVKNLSKFQFIAVNFANPDMVGHTGNLKATIQAVEHCDKCLGAISKAVLQQNGCMIITADHGNAEKMIDLKTGEIYPRHTTNPVPFILVNKKFQHQRLQKGVLGNISPTIYKLLKISISKSKLLNPLF